MPLHHHRKHHFRQLLNFPQRIIYNPYWNVNNDKCFCDPVITSKKFSSITNVVNTSNYLRVANVLSSPSSLRSARLQFALTTIEGLAKFETFNNSKLLNVPKNRF
jgi:hypothetical protein